MSYNEEKDKQEGVFMGYIKDLDQYLNTVKEEHKRKILKGLLDWVLKEFPDLRLEIKWNQPMFIHKETFIIAISALKNHISVAPEAEPMKYFSDEIKLAGYEQTAQLFRIKFNDSINHTLIERIIKYNIKEKKDYPKFWREY